MQMVRLAAHLLDAPVQFTAQSITRQHGRAVAVGHAPQHLAQKIPPLFPLITGGLLQLAKQGSGDGCAARPPNSR